MYNFLAVVEEEEARRAGKLKSAEVKPAVPNKNATDEEIIQHAKNVLDMKNGREYNYLRGWKQINKTK